MSSTSTAFPSDEDINALLASYAQGRLDTVLAQGEILGQRFPETGPLLNILGAAAIGMGRFEQASAYFRQAIAANPQDAAAHHNLGFVLQGIGQIQEAIESYRRALAINPDYLDAYNNLGHALYTAGQDEEAIAAYSRALAIKPDYAEVHNNLAAVLSRSGALADAEAHCRKAIGIDPNCAAAYVNLGNVLEKLDQPDQAIIALQRAIAIDPRAADAHFNLGNVLRRRGERDAAAESYRRVLAVHPRHAGALNNLGNMLQQANRNSEALAAYQRATEIEPSYAEAHYNMAGMLQSLGRVAESIPVYDRAIFLNPRHVESHYNRGGALQEIGRIEEAIASYAQALTLDPNYTPAHASKLQAQAQICDWEGMLDSRSGVSALGLEGEVVSPFTLLGLEDSPARHRERAVRYAAARYLPPHPVQPFMGRTAGPLRIGYFSADFRDHPVANLIVRLFECHDRGACKIFAYAYGPPSDDPVRQRVMKAVDVFHDVRTRDDQEVVNLARQDEIDVAVDLTGYTLGARTNIFARRAAQVQINYLGYPGTLGAGFMDYILADKSVIPESSLEYYAEKPIYLPHCYLPTDDTLKIHSQPMSRVQAGLPAAGFVFCSFNNIYKTTPAEFDVWMSLLRRVEGSVMWMNKPNKQAQENLEKQAIKRGVSANRLVFAGRVPKAEYHVRLALGDLFLDAFTYNAHSTAVDAMWAGLPIISKAGEGMAARAGVSVLTAMGVPELVVNSVRDYEDLAFALATDHQKLRELKSRLSHSRSNGPFFDAQGFARHVESAYAQAHARYAAGHEPSAITVAP